MDDKRRDEEHQHDHPLLDDDRFDEETAAEIVDPDIKDRDDNDVDLNVYGWVSIALSVISFFFIPILFAGAGIIVGFIARNREAPILGNIAIAVGVISLLFRLIIMPLI
jgi:hypothetical protein